MEKVMSQAGRSANHYHSENGRFVDNGFVDSINSKYQKLNFCGVRTHHHNSIIENTNKMLTTGARTLILNVIRMWPQIIDNMFWPFSMKAVAERLKHLQVYSLGRMPESILHDIEVKYIPVKSYNKPFCPIYMLDAHLQNAGGAGPSSHGMRTIP